MKRSLCGSLIILTLVTVSAVAQSPSPTPGTEQDKRGLGVQSSTSSDKSQAASATSREAKPELVLQTGYNNFFGATRLVFSPDAKLLATSTFRSSTIKLWETASGRELRNLSGDTQSGLTMSPYIAFSRDSRLIAAATGNSSVKIWEVASGRELQTLTSTQVGMAAALSGVYFIAFTADNRLITISDAVRLWDVNSGQQLQSTSLPTFNAAGIMGGEGGASLTPDGTQLAYAVSETSGYNVKFWDLVNGREARSVEVSDKDIQGPALAFTPDGRLVLAGRIEQQIKLWDVSNKSKERDLGTTAHEYDPLTFSRDGRLLAIADGYNVKIVDVNSGREMTVLKAPNGGLIAQQQARVFASFSSDGKKVATSGFDTPTIVWEAETGKQLVKMSGRTNMAYKVAFSADGSRLSSGGRTRWDLRTGRGIRVIPSGIDKGFGMPNPEGTLLAAFTPYSNAVTILEVPTGRVLQTLTPSASGGSVQHVNFSPDGSKLVTTYMQMDPAAGAGTHGGIENQVKIWDVKNGKELVSFTTNGPAGDASFSNDGKVVATLGSAGDVSLWDAQSGSRLKDLTTTAMSKITSMANPGAMRPGAIKPGSMPNLADISAMMTDMMGAMSAGTMGRTVTSVAFSTDGRVIATGGVESKSNFDMNAMMASATNPKKNKNKKPPDPQDIMRDMKVESVGQVVLWDAASGNQIAALKGHGKGVSQIAFSRDGRWLASAATDNTIKIWDVAARRELKTLAGHTANIESMDFSPDGKLLASASDDGGTFLWDTTTGEHLLTLISLDDGGEWMVVTPQGLFDGTPASWNQILWRYNQDTFNVAPIEWFFNEFYYPGLLSDVLAGKRPQVSLDVSKKDRRQPLVKLSVVGDTPAAGITSRTVKVRIDVSDAPGDKENPQGSGARDLRLFRNGSLVTVWHGDVLNGKTDVSLEQEVTITAGANRLTAYAFNKDNVKSKDAQLPLTGADVLKRAGTAYVIAVGINEYSNPQYNLKYAVADAQSFGEEVRSRLSQTTTFEHFEVIPLLNTDATKANILSALKRLAGTSEP